MLTREYSAVPIHFARLQERQTEVTAEERSVLVEYVSVSAWIASISFGQGRFKLEPEAPGYLRTEVGARSYFVPFGLAGVFPNAQQLASLDSIVHPLRLSARSAICLSGSSTFTGQILGVSDIDFCEYFLEGAPALRDCLSGKTSSKTTQSDRAQLVRVKRSDDALCSPFVQAAAWLGKLFDGHDVALEPVKLDFVAKVEPFGVIAATNLVLPLNNEDGSSGMWSRSFQYQEAVILEGPNALPVRPLINPQDLGRYLNWLRAQAEHYAHMSREGTQAEQGTFIYGGYALKSLKRSLSWYLMVGLNSSVESIIALFRRPEMAAVAAFQRESEVHRLLDRLDEGATPSLRDLLGVPTVAAKMPNDDLKSFFDSALALAEVLVCEIADLMRDGEGGEVAA